MLKFYAASGLSATLRELSERYQGLQVAACRSPGADDLIFLSIRHDSTASGVEIGYRLSTVEDVAQSRLFTDQDVERILADPSVVIVSEPLVPSLLDPDTGAYIGNEDLDPAIEE